MDHFLVDRGGQHINLHKSSHLIGLRSTKPGKLGKLLGRSDKVTSIHKFLAGFELFIVDGDLQQTEIILDELRERNPHKTGTHIYHLESNEAAYAPTGKIVVRFKSGVTQNIQEEFHLKLVSQEETTYVYAVTTASPNPLKVAQALQDKPGILLAEADLSTEAELCAYVAPTDIYLKEQWHLRNTGSSFGQTWGMTAGADARVVAAWEATGNFGAPECVIAVIDDGFDLTHPDLADMGRVRAPYDFEKKQTDPSPQNFTPWPGDIHGTATAGLAIGAATGQCIAGVAPGCSFMPLRWSRNLNDDSIRTWFAYARDHGAWVVNCSWTGPKGYVLSTRQKEAIADCASKGRHGMGCVIVFSAGNRFAPAEGFALLPDVIAVGACTSNDDQSQISSFGKTVAVCAPSEGMGGRKIVTSNVSGMVMDAGVERPKGWSDQDQDYTADFSGTSASAPIASGVCGLILSVRPDLTAAEVKQILMQSARKIGHGYNNGHSDHFGCGCVNAAAAVQLASAL